MSLADHPQVLYLAFLLQFLISVSPTQNLSQPYTPTDLILLNCGVSSDTTSPDGRIWNGDAQSKFLASTSPASPSFTASQPDPSVPEVPYITARIFYSSFNYSFPVLPGPKFVRLYFYPTTYFNLDPSKSFFSLMANNYTLLNNFSAFLTVSAMRPQVYFVKEFVINVLEEKLKVIFSPSPTSFAFVNGIEVISMPDNLYLRGYDYPLTYVGMAYNFYLDNMTTALESIYRLNVGGAYISGLDDTGMYRTWLDDTDYIFGSQGGVPPIPRFNVTVKYTNNTPAYTAPELVYRTYRTMDSNPEVNLRYNLTWNFLVDTGFNYLVRLHFCDTRMEVTKEGEDVFFIFINNQTAVIDADVIYWSGGNNVPVFKDFILWVPEGSSSLWLALHPNVDLTTKHFSAILNGIEIFKLNDSNGSLAGPNPDPQPIAMPSPPQQMEKTNNKGKLQPSLVLLVAGATFGCIFLVSISLCFFVLKKRKKVFDKNCDANSSWMKFSFTSRSTTVTTGSRLPSELCRRFSIFEIEIATGKFDDECIVGCGGFGNVYKGYIDDGLTPVAIKCLHSRSKQGAREFRTEIEMLSKLRHLHLVALIGYCDDQGEMILVYEYMHNGNLRDHLYNTKNSPLPWKQRLKICIGAAKGLHYLHTGTKHTIIHRDVKSTNILLDDNWVAKVSDFGLSRTGPTGVSETHVSTVVRGSFGYVDPEYFRRQHLTEKSDVYSFGVVLFEVLSARPPVIPGLPKEQISLAEWARNCYENGNLEQIMDPNLKGNIAPVCLRKFGEIAYSCVHGKGIERPTMSDVAWGLEFALQLQETAEKNLESTDHNVSNGQESPLLLRSWDHVVTTSDDDDMFSGSSGGQHSNSKSTISNSGNGEVGRNIAHSDHDGLRIGNNVFSEIMDPKGR